jgi:restriction endonuclease S subunit
LYFWIVNNIKKITKGVGGSTVKSLRKFNFEFPLIKLPNIEVQKQIIDIIEPIAKLILILEKIKEKMENITTKRCFSNIPISKLLI